MGVQFSKPAQVSGETAPLLSTPTTPAPPSTPTSHHNYRHTKKHRNYRRQKKQRRQESQLQGTDPMATFLQTCETIRSASEEEITRQFNNHILRHAQPQPHPPTPVFETLDQLFASAAKTHAATTVLSWLFSAGCIGVGYFINSAQGAAAAGPAIQLQAAIASAAVNTAFAKMATEDAFIKITHNVKELAQRLQAGDWSTQDLLHWIVTTGLAYGVTQISIPAAAPFANGFKDACTQLAAALKKTSAPDFIKTGIGSVLLDFLNPIWTIPVKWAQAGLLSKDLIQLIGNKLDQLGWTGGDGGASDDWKAIIGILNGDDETLKRKVALLLEKAFSLGLLNSDSDALAFKDARSPENTTIKAILKATTRELSWGQWAFKGAQYISTTYLTFALAGATAAAFTHYYESQPLDWIDHSTIMANVDPGALQNEWVAANYNFWSQVFLYAPIIVTKTYPMLWNNLFKQTAALVLSGLDKALSFSSKLPQVPDNYKAWINPEDRSFSNLLGRAIGNAGLTYFFYLTIFNALQEVESGHSDVDFGSPQFMKLLEDSVIPFVLLSNMSVWSDINKFFAHILEWGTGKISKLSFAQKITDLFEQSFHVSSAEINKPLHKAKDWDEYKQILGQLAANTDCVKPSFKLTLEQVTEYVELWQKKQPGTVPPMPSSDLPFEALLGTFVTTLGQYFNHQGYTVETPVTPVNTEEVPASEDNVATARSSTSSPDIVATSPLITIWEKSDPTSQILTKSNTPGLKFSDLPPGCTHVLKEDKDGSVSYLALKLNGYIASENPGDSLAPFLLPKDKNATPCKGNTYTFALNKQTAEAVINAHLTGSISGSDNSLNSPRPLRIAHSEQQSDGSFKVTVVCTDQDSAKADYYACDRHGKTVVSLVPLESFCTYHVLDNKVIISNVAQSIKVVKAPQAHLDHTSEHSDDSEARRNRSLTQQILHRTEERIADLVGYVHQPAKKNKSQLQEQLIIEGLWATHLRALLADEALLNKQIQTLEQKSDQTDKEAKVLAILKASLQYLTGHIENPDKPTATTPSKVWNYIKGGSLLGGCAAIFASSALYAPEPDEFSEQVYAPIIPILKGVIAGGVTAATASAIAAIYKTITAATDIFDATKEYDKHPGKLDSTIDETFRHHLTTVNSNTTSRLEILRDTLQPLIQDLQDNQGYSSDEISELSKVSKRLIAQIQRQNTLHAYISREDCSNRPMVQDELEHIEHAVKTPFTTFEQFLKQYDRQIKYDQAASAVEKIELFKNALQAFCLIAMCTYAAVEYKAQVNATPDSPYVTDYIQTAEAITSAARILFDGLAVALGIEGSAIIFEQIVTSGYRVTDEIKEHLLGCCHPHPQAATAFMSRRTSDDEIISLQPMNS